MFALQQYLLIAVLKLVTNAIVNSSNPNWVGTTPTACGIETLFQLRLLLILGLFVVATTPTACGIETTTHDGDMPYHHKIATTPTARGMRRRV